MINFCIKWKGTCIVKNGSRLRINVFIQRELFGNSPICKPGTKWPIGTRIILLCKKKTSVCKTAVWRNFPLFHSHRIINFQIVTDFVSVHWKLLTSKLRLKIQLIGIIEEVFSLLQEKKMLCEIYSSKASKNHCARFNFFFHVVTEFATLGLFFNQ